MIQPRATEAAIKGWRVLALLLVSFVVTLSPAHADAMLALEEFVRTTHSGRAEFSQTVSSPGKDGQPSRSRMSSGTFEFIRPHRFRFAYTKPFVQYIVADGQTLWLHDLDLNQVTARKQSQTLGSTAAALIASAASLAAMEADFALQAAPDRDGLRWVQATPRVKDGPLRSVAVGLRAQGRSWVLAALEMSDNFGQRSVLAFSNFAVNPSLDPGLFRFTPPAGADLVRP